MGADYFTDLDVYEYEFECNECGNSGIENFNYMRTVANGEVWRCRTCKNELLTMNKPNEDNY